jgi:hypothetical protein
MTLPSIPQAMQRGPLGGVIDPDSMPTIRGAARPPESSISRTPIVGPAFQPTNKLSRQARDWALFALIVGYPLWRLLGFTLFIIPLLGIPMALELYRRRRIKLPAGFGFLALLLLVALVGVLMLGKTPPFALPPAPGIGRYLAWAQRLGDFLTAAIILLYVGNLSERELPTKRVVKMLSALFLMVVVGGYLGMLLPNTTLQSPMSHVLPHSLKANSFVQLLTTVQFAQVQDVIGSPKPRPDFPFTYTNGWGEAVVLLAPFFFVAMLQGTKKLSRRIWVGVVLVAALVPTIYSLNRGMWGGIAIAIAYVLYRFARTGRALQVAVTLGAIALVAVIVLVTPLSAVISGREANPKSNDGRANINSAAFAAAKSSPFIGYGGLANERGSGRTITAGPTAKCPTCGTLTIGGSGQMWQLLITTGFLGTGAYIAFLVRFGWRYRRDSSPIGMIGMITVLVSLLFMTVYSALDLPLMIIMIALGLWWRHSENRLVE